MPGCTASLHPRMILVLGLLACGHPEEASSVPDDPDTEVGAIEPREPYDEYVVVEMVLEGERGSIFLDPDLYSKQFSGGQATLSEVVVNPGTSDHQVGDVLCIAGLSLSENSTIAVPTVPCPECTYVSQLTGAVVHSSSRGDAEHCDTFIAHIADMLRLRNFGMGLRIEAEEGLGEGEVLLLDPGEGPNPNVPGDEGIAPEWGVPPSSHARVWVGQPDLRLNFEYGFSLGTYVRSKQGGPSDPRLDTGWLKPIETGGGWVQWRVHGEGTLDPDPPDPEDTYQGITRLSLEVVHNPMGVYPLGHVLCEYTWPAGTDAPPAPPLPCEDCDYTFAIAHTALPTRWQEGWGCNRYSPLRVERNVYYADVGLGFALEPPILFWYWDVHSEALEGWYDLDPDDGDLASWDPDTGTFSWTYWGGGPYYYSAGRGLQVGPGLGSTDLLPR